MKKQILILLTILFSGLSTTAQVGISATNTPPNASAMLDVSSTNKGLLPPRMSTAQRNAIVSPADGLLVFDTNTQSYWYRRSSTWTELPQSTAAVNFWQQTGAGGNEIKNTNTGGFWSANPVGLTDYSDNISNPPTAPVSGAGTRMMWIPSRSAFRVGSVIGDKWDANNVGLHSFASGYNSTASGYFSTAIGYSSVASGSSSTAMNGGTASGIGSFALSGGNSSGNRSFAIGINSYASGEGSISIGQDSNASGNYSISMGLVSSAIGYGSTAMGTYTIASGSYSTVIGKLNVDNYDGLFMVGNGNILNNTRYTAFIIRKDNNRVGIGVEAPIARLHVVGTGSPVFVNYGVYFGNNGIFYPYSGTNPSALANSAAIYADGTICSNNVIGSYLTVVSSDNRIKKDFSLSNNSEDLERLKKIQITNYRMKDVATWGTQTFKKVIAQQVESVYPEVISKTKSVIPDIYALAESVVYDAQDKKLNVLLSKDYGIKIGDKIELVHPEKGKIQAEVVEVLGKSFTVKNWEYATDKIFVFGREVNDFRSVDYEALSMLGISAIQALAKEVEGLKKENIQLKSDFNKRLESIEASLRLTN
jgi:hypothetical protein